MHRIDQLFAAAIALLITGVTIWLLVRITHPLVGVQDKLTPAIELVWIIQTSDQPPEEKPSRTRAIENATRPVATSRRPAKSLHEQGLTVVAIPDAHVPSTIVHEDRWAPATPATLDLGLPETPRSFQRDPLTRRTRPLQATPDRMRLAFVDRSIGGTLQRMTRGQTCHELRTALYSMQGNADVIVKEMQEHGCIH